MQKEKLSKFIMKFFKRKPFSKQEGGEDES